jgi:hypothetical protein
MKKFLLTFLAIGFLFSAKAQTDCGDFFISEYVEGTFHNKAIEIYNPTSTTKNLSNYCLRRYKNAAATASETLNLVGSVAAYDVWIVTNGTIVPDTYGASIDSVLWNMADQHGSGSYDGADPCYFNGNDAITIERISDGGIVDIFARIGPPDAVGGWYDQPGTNGDYTTSFDWQAWTVDHTLIRKQTVKKGITANPSPFMVAVEYDSLMVNDWSHLGQHTCDCQPGAGVESFTNENNVYFFPNPVVDGKLTIKGTNVITKVEIVNILGKNIFYRENAANRADMYIELGNLPEGVYFVKSYFADKSIISRKIIVK